GVPAHCRDRGLLRLAACGPDSAEQRASGGVDRAPAHWLASVALRASTRRGCVNRLLLLDAGRWRGRRRALPPGRDDPVRGERAPGAGARVAGRLDRWWTALPCRWRHRAGSTRERPRQP